MSTVAARSATGPVEAAQNVDGEAKVLEEDAS